MPKSTPEKPPRPPKKRGNPLPADPEAAASWRDNRRLYELLAAR
jgi:hypothetical protein